MSHFIFYFFEKASLRRRNYTCSSSSSSSWSAELSTKLPVRGPFALHGVSAIGTLRLELLLNCIVLILASSMESADKALPRAT